MKLIERNYCVFSGKQDLEHLYTIKDFPAFVGCVDHAPEKDIKVDMSWWISKSSGGIQLNPLIPLDILYGSGHGSGSVGKVWQQHHQEFAKFVHECGLGDVLEIGGGHGILAQNCLQLRPDVKWTIVEPNPIIPLDSKIRVIRQLFDSEFIIDKEVDAVVHSHLLEHTYEPLAFMAQISRSLRQGKRHLFSVPHLQIMLERKYTNCINFEHAVFLTEPFIEYILHSNGFMIKEKHYFLEDHSIFYATIRDDAAISFAQLPNEYEHNRKIYMDYIQYHIDLIKELNSKMSNQRGDIFLFGGHIFAQYLLGFGLDESRIQCILDNDPHKQGRRLYGSKLMVLSPKILRNVDNPVVILRAGIYNEEIKKDILENINPNVIFWE